MEGPAGAAAIADAGGRRIGLQRGRAAGAHPDRRRRRGRSGRHPAALAHQCAGMCPGHPPPPRAFMSRRPIRGLIKIQGARAGRSSTLGSPDAQRSLTMPLPPRDGRRGPISREACARGRSHPRAGCRRAGDRVLRPRVHRRIQAGRPAARRERRRGRAAQGKNDRAGRRGEEGRGGVGGMSERASERASEMEPHRRSRGPSPSRAGSNRSRSRPPPTSGGAAAAGRS